MIYRKKYTIDSAFILPGPPESIKWSATGCGEYIIGERGGKKYFIKRSSMGLRYPASTLPEPLYSEALRAAQRLENKQKDIKKLFSGLDVDADHIVVEEENFWDDNVFSTVTRMVDGEMKDADHTSLSQAAFLTLCRDLMVLLKKIHAAGVTHGDLKVKNIIIANRGGALVPYLIDFDSSYPSDYGTRTGKDGKPLLSYPVVFSPGYESPEIAWYNYNEEGDVPASTITNKTDIFTMAIIFHQLWAGSFPAIESDQCDSVGVAVYNDAPIKFDTKFNIPLGPVNESSFASLLKWMLEKDTSRRPSAEQVLDALNDVIEVPDEYSADGAQVKFDLEPHTIHKAALELLTKDELKAKGVKSFVKVTSGGEYKYSVKLKDGSERMLSIDEVISLGYGKSKSASVCTLWPADDEKYELLGADAFEAAKVISVEQKEVAFRRFYYVVFRSGISTTMGVSGLRDLGLIKEKLVLADSASVDADTPWPDHGTAYNTEAMAKRGILKVEKVVEAGDNRYMIIYADKQMVVKASYMKLMGYIS